MSRSAVTERSTRPPRHSRVFVDDGHNLDRSSVGGGVELEVDGPDLIRGVGLRPVGRCASAGAFTSSPVRHAQPFLAPEPLDLLVVDVPALGVGIVISRPEPPPRVVLGVAAKPDPQRRVRTGCGGACRLSPLCGSVLPGDPAGEPFAHAHHTDEVSHGRPPAFRA